MGKVNPLLFVRFIQKQVIRRPFVALLFILIFVYLCSASLIMVFERLSFGGATNMIVPAFLGELGMVQSPNIVTQTSILAALVASVAFLAVITAKVTSMFVEFCSRGGSIVKKVNLSDHIIICGWNFQGEKIVSELLQSGLKGHRGIVILANCECRPVKDERVEFIRGDPTQDNDLIRAGVKRAKSVIVLTDFTKNANEADAKALMIVLAVESLHRKVHTSVQILNHVNRIHLKRAHADEIICLDQIGGNLVVASALNRGVSRVLTELLTFNTGSEFYRYDKPISFELVGKEFFKAVELLAIQKMILIAVETDDSPEIWQELSEDVLHSVEDETRIIIVNPQSRYKIRQGDALFVIAESEPNKL